MQTTGLSSVTIPGMMDWWGRPYASNPAMDGRKPCLVGKWRRPTSPAEWERRFEVVGRGSFLTSIAPKGRAGVFDYQTAELIFLHGMSCIGREGSLSITWKRPRIWVSSIINDAQWGRPISRSHIQLLIIREYPLRESRRKFRDPCQFPAQLPAAWLSLRAYPSLKS